MTSTNHSLTPPYFPSIPLKTAAELIGIDYAVMKQPKRRVLLGLVDSPAPSRSLDRRIRFLTGESINAFLAKKAIRKQISQLTLTQTGSHRHDQTLVGIAPRKQHLH